LFHEGVHEKPLAVARDRILTRVGSRRLGNFDAEQRMRRAC